jgi:hypothetical protein
MQCNCGSRLFFINKIPCCDNCTENGAYDEDSDNGNGNYVYDEKTINEKGLIRNHVAEHNECKYGSAYEAGCYMLICESCKNKSNIPIVDC